MHIAGVGDYNLAGVTDLADPCPLPSAAKKKGLRDKEKLFYAPMSGLGDLLYDKDAVYVNLNDHFVQYSKVDNEIAGVMQKGFHICYIIILFVFFLTYISYLCSLHGSVTSSFHLLLGSFISSKHIFILKFAFPLCKCNKFLLLIIWVNVLTGKGHDVGEALVKSLQNTKYSIDEKLEKSFIDLFGRKPNMLAEAQMDSYTMNVAEVHNRKIENYHSGEAMETDSSDDEIGSEDDGRLASSSHGEGVESKTMMDSEDNSSDEENNDSTDQDNLKENAEFHSGRLRRKVVFKDDIAEEKMKVGK